MVKRKRKNMKKEKNKFYVTSLAVDISSFNRFNEMVMYDGIPHLRPAQLNITATMKLMAFGDFTEYTKPDKTIDIDKVESDIFKGKIKIDFINKR